MKQVLIVAGLLLGPAAVAVAQQPTTPTKPAITAGLSLSDAIAVAREKNPAYRQAQNNRGPAAWGVRAAYSSLLIPSVSASGGMSYTGPGSQTFLAQSFSQSVSTVSSFYDLGLSWQLSGTTLSQPGLAKAKQRATDADIAGAENALVTGIKQQYLTVLQARAQDGQVLLLDTGDERVLRPGNVGIGGALFGFRESRLGQRGARQLPRQSQIIE